ncbi:MAG: RDD family protein [Dehalococcoidia bacterium]
MRAVAFDVALCAGGQVVVAAVALLVFVLQTGGGETDLTARSATAGWAVALAGVPAWLGLLGHSSSLLGGTPGQRGARLAVEGSASRRLARLAAHPLGAIAWTWLALVAALATIPVVPILLAATALLAILAGLVSGAMLLRDPAALTLHDRIAGTRLVARR